MDKLEVKECCEIVRWVSCFKRLTAWTGSLSNSNVELKLFGFVSLRSDVVAMIDTKTTKCYLTLRTVSSYSAFESMDMKACCIWIYSCKVFNNTALNVEMPYLYVKLLDSDSA